MKTLRFYIVLLAVLLFDTYGFPQTSNPKVLEEYLVITGKNNPEVKAAFNRYLASLEKAPQVSSLPDPQLSMDIFVQPMELVDGNELANFRLMQMFPWFGTLKAAKDEASMMAKARYQEFNSAKADLYFKVTASWYQVLKYDQEIKLQQENIKLLESLEQNAMTRFQNPAVEGNNDQKTPASSGMTNTPQNSANNGSGNMVRSNMQTGSGNNEQSGIMPSGTSSGMGAGQSGLTDVLRVRMEILEQKDQLELLKDQKKTEEANFNSLLNRDQNSEVHVTDTVELNTLSLGQIALIDTTLSKNPMLAMLDAESQSYLLMQKKARKMGLPMFGIGVDYTLIQKGTNGMSSSMNGRDMVMPMFSLTLPIYRKKYKAMQNEAKYMYEASLLEKESTKNMLQLQSRQVMRDLNDAARRAELYNELGSLSRKTSGLLLSGYTTGGNSYEEVLRNQYKVLDYGFKYVDAIIDYNTAVARAEKLMNSVSY